MREISEVVLKLFFRNLYKVERKGIPINLKSTSPEGEVSTFTSIPEAAAGLGFSERGVRKAYHKSRNRIGEYQLERLEPEVEIEEPKEELDPKAIERIERMKKAIGEPNCIYCGKPLSRKDRVEDGFTIMRMGRYCFPAEENFTKSLYEAHKLTGLSLFSLKNAAEKGNISITRRKDKQEFLISWDKIHDICFEIRKEERRMKRL